MKLLKFGALALDGTKVKANANKLDAQLSTEVNALIQRAEAADRDAVADGMDIPAESHGVKLVWRPLQRQSSKSKPVRKNGMPQNKLFTRIKQPNAMHSERQAKSRVDVTPSPRWVVPAIRIK